MTEIFANNAGGVLAAEAADTDTSISLDSGHTFPAPGADDFFRATLFEVVGGNEVNHEIVRVTDVSSDTLTVERAQEGTTARTWGAGTEIELRLTAAVLSDGLLLAPASLDGDANLYGVGAKLLTVSGTSHTVTASDAGKILYCTSSDAVTITLPEEATEALPTGFSIGIIRAGTGGVSVAVEGSDTLNNIDNHTEIEARWGMAFATLVNAGSPNTWLFDGRTV